MGNGLQIEDISLILKSLIDHKYSFVDLMDLLTKEDRENLIIEYKQLHDENWQRGHAIWVVNSILITGSLIAAFQTNNANFPTPIVSLMLIVIVTILHATGDKVTSITYKQMEEIRKKLGMTESSMMYKSKIQGKWWHTTRRSAAYILFIFLMAVYILLLFDSLGLLKVTFSTVT
jgi:hypothetical protein